MSRLKSGINQNFNVHLLSRFLPPNITVGLLLSVSIYVHSAKVMTILVKLNKYNAICQLY